MTPATDHIDDSLLSALVDDHLTAEEMPRVLAHLGTCSLCEQRLNDLRAVASLLRGMPDVLPPRDFALGPRLLIDPPNVIRLRRWYGIARTAAASLAAVFVFLSVGTFYVDSRSGLSAPAPELASGPSITQAPVPAAQNAQPPAATAALRAAAPAQAPASAGAGAAVRPASSPQADDQVAAATTVRALPTPVPTLVSTAAVRAAAPTAASVPPDPAGPLRVGAVIVGILAALTVLAAVAVRHRLQRAATQF